MKAESMSLNEAIANSPMPEYDGPEPIDSQLAEIQEKLDADKFDELDPVWQDWVCSRLMPSLARYGTYPPPEEQRRHQFLNSPRGLVFTMLQCYRPDENRGMEQSVNAIVNVAEMRGYDGRAEFDNWAKSEERTESWTMSIMESLFSVFDNDMEVVAVFGVAPQGKAQVSF